MKTQRDDVLFVLAHPKPMRRHTSHVVGASIVARVRLPGDVNMPSPGLYLELMFEGGATQLLIFPLGQQVGRLAQYARMAATLKEETKEERAAAVEKLRVEFEQLANKNAACGLSRSRKGTYVNPATARDWKWFQLGAIAQAQEKKA